MSRIKAIVFDFDGTIVPGSETVKENAWRFLFSEDEDDLCAALLKFGEGKGSRFDIIRFILERKGMADDGSVASYSRKFDEETQKAINELGVPLNIRLTLEKLKENYPLFINTATPTEAIEQTLVGLGIREMFAGVYGRPFSKFDNLKSIANLLEAEPSSIVFIGDGRGDKEAAESFGCFFIGIANKNNGWEPQISKDSSVINHLGNCV